MLSYSFWYQFGKKMQNLKFAVIGTGFWAAYQVPAWLELPGVDLIAVCDHDQPKADALARQFGVPNVYTTVDELLDRHGDELHFVDVITSVDSHAQLVAKAADRGLNVICQKPMGPDLAVARQMVNRCQRAGVRFYVHENFRWQTPIRTLKAVLNSGVIGRPFNARVSFCSAFPVFDNQPFLADLEQFILTDIGSHILDICRFLFGEAKSLYSRTNRIRSGIRGEDVANVLLTMTDDLICYAEMSYASILEREAFPQTFVSVEGECGSVVLTHNFVIKTTTRSGTEQIVASPPVYPWADPAYALVHASIVDCNRNILSDMQGTVTAETTGINNLKTVELVYAAYESAARNAVIAF